MTESTEQTTPTNGGGLASLKLAQLQALASQLGIPGGSLALGAPADLLLFHSERGWRIEADALPGRAGNTPFDGLPVSGQVLRLLKGGETLFARATT